MEITLKQSKNLHMLQRFAISNSALRRQHTNSVEAIRDYVKARAKERNTITISITKITRPVFMERKNPETPPAITDHVRTLARFIRTSNEITAHEPKIFHHFNCMLNKPLSLRFNSRDEAQPLWVLLATPTKNHPDSLKIYTVSKNISSEAKPAFRHDSLFLFDTLSEDYSA